MVKNKPSSRRLSFTLVEFRRNKGSDNFGNCKREIKNAAYISDAANVQM